MMKDEKRRVSFVNIKNIQHVVGAFIVIVVYRNLNLGLRQDFILTTKNDAHQEYSNDLIVRSDSNSLAIFFNTYVNPNSTENGKDIIFQALDAINNQTLLNNAAIYYTRFGHLDIPWPERECTGESFNLNRKCIEIKSAHEGDEMIMLQALFEYCNEPDNLQKRVVYLHSKGSHNNNLPNTCLRKILFKSVLSDECLTFPQDGRCSVCSSQFSTRPFFHYVGNMWVAECKYISKLIPPKDFRKAKVAIVEKMLQHTTPKKFRPNTKVTFTTNITFHSGDDDDNKRNQLFYRFRARDHFAIERESWLGIGRYASEQYIFSHPEARPCDVFSPISSKLNRVIIYGDHFELDNLRWAIDKKKVLPMLNIIPETIRQGKNETIILNGGVENQEQHPWYQQFGRIYEYKALYPESGGPEKESWLFDYWGNLNLPNQQFQQTQSFNS